MYCRKSSSKSAPRARLELGELVVGEHPRHQCAAGRREARERRGRRARRTSCARSASQASSWAISSRCETSMRSASGGRSLRRCWRGPARSSSAPAGGGGPSRCTKATSASVYAGRLEARRPRRGQGPVRLRRVRRAGRLARPPSEQRGPVVVVRTRTRRRRGEQHDGRGSVGALGRHRSPGARGSVSIAPDRTVHGVTHRGDLGRRTACPSPGGLRGRRLDAVRSWHRRSGRRLAVLVGAGLLALAPATASGQSDDDPRVGLAPGLLPVDARRAATSSCSTTTRVSRRSTPHPATSASSTPTSRSPATNAIVGSFNGFQVYDISDPADPVLRGVVRLPRRAGRRVGLRQPAVHVGRGDPRPHRLRHAGRARRRSTPSGSAACASSTSATSTTRCSCPACRPAAARTPTRRHRPATTRPTSTSTTPAPPASARRSSWRAARTPRRRTSPVTTGTRRSGASTSSRCRSRPRRRRRIVSQPRIFTDPATGAFNGLQNTLPGAAAPVGHALQPAAEHQHLPRHHGLPASSVWRPAPARATASCSTSPTR